MKEQEKISDKSALLIIDVQNDYFDGGKMTLTKSLEASQQAKILLDKFRNLNLPVIFIQHINLKPDATFFLPNTKGIEIHENVKPLPGEKIIIKHKVNSYLDTDLLEYLHKKKITDLIICGMMTHMCVDATTRASSDNGFKCTLVSDACATKILNLMELK